MLSYIEFCDFGLTYMVFDNKISKTPPVNILI